MVFVDTIRVIVMAEDISSSTYKKQVKKSGLLSGGGLGFTIGSEKRKDQYDNQNIEQAGSTVGSISGSVNVEAGKDVNISASDVLAGKDINLTGQNVTIESADNTYNAQEKHEYKKTGITVSLGGQTVEAVQKITDPIQRATEVKDEKLKALYELNTLHDLQKNVNNIGNTLDNIDAKDESAAFKLSIGIGSASSKSKLESEVTVAKGSNVAAGGDITVTATEKDINIKGSNVSGENVTLDAKENINITSSENSTNNEFDASNKSFGASVDFGVSGIIGGGINYGKGSSAVDTDGITHTNSNITANKDLAITSGEDVNIKGGKVSGDKVTAAIGGNLNVESQQDTDNYTAKDKNFGIDIGIDKKPQGSGIAFGKDTTNTDSKYSSVTDQSGIYVGEGGFDITVDKNTDLKGGIIDSDATPDKNKLTTGTLTWEDMDNKAEYSSKSDGFSGSISQHHDLNDGNKTKNDFVGNMNPGAEIADEAESTTKAGVAAGTIEITDKEKQKQNIEDLNRDTKNALNSLGKIFDAQDVRERQEFFGVFSQTVFNAIGDLGLKEGSPEKIALDAAAGALIAKLGGANAMSGMTGAAIAQLAENFLKDIKDPLVHQLLSYVISGSVTKLAGGSFQTGAAIGSNEAKYNYLTHKQYADYQAELAACKGDADKEKEVKARYKKLSDEQTLAGDLGEASGEGFEWGIDLDENGDFKGFTVSGDLSAVANSREHEIVEFMKGNIDRSTWSDNELRTYTIGGNVGIKQFAGGSFSVGYAVDKEGNVYKVVVGSVNAGVNLSNITKGDILKAVSTVAVNVSKQVIPGEKLGKKDLKDAYKGVSFSLAKTDVGVQVAFAKGGSNTVGYGVNNAVTSVDFGIVYLEPIN